MNKVGDYSKEETTILEKIKMVFIAIAMIVMFWAFAAIASAYEEHKLCMNGAIEHCIPEDFQ